MKTRTLLALGAMLMGIQLAGAQGTGFTYQGRLNDGTNLANGYYDMRFGLSDGPANPSISSEATNSVPVSDGLFTVVLDLGANFPGADRWLEIQVKTNGGASYSVLTPRQKLTPTPYAIYAGNAAQVGGQSASAFVAKAGDTMTGTLNVKGGALSFEHPSNPVPYVGMDYDSVSDSLRLRANQSSTSLNTTLLTVQRTSGNVGIGTTSPNGQVEVSGTSAEFTPPLQVNDKGSRGMSLIRMTVGDNYPARWDVGASSNSFLIYSGLFGKQYLAMDTNGVSVGNNNLLVPGGNVGIGTTSPQAKLDVNGDIKAFNLPGLRYNQSNGAVGTYYMNEANATVDSIQFSVPAKGVLLVSAFVHTAGPWDTNEDFKLLQAGVELVKTTSGTKLAEHTLFWVIPVSAKGSLSFQTLLWRVADLNGNSGANYFAHNLTAVYLPVEY